MSLRDYKNVLHSADSDGMITVNRLRPVTSYIMRDGKLVTEIVKYEKVVIRMSVEEFLRMAEKDKQCLQAWQHANEQQRQLADELENIVL